MTLNSLFCSLQNKEEPLLSVKEKRRETVDKPGQAAVPMHARVKGDVASLRDAGQFLVSAG